MKADEVSRYLQDHPEFFEQYAEQMAQLAIPHPHGGRTISIVERQILALREKNRQLEAKLHDMIKFGEENHAISEKMQRLAVALIGAGSGKGVLQTLAFHLREDFALPHFVLHLWQKPEDAADLPEFAAVDEELQVFAETLGQPYCGATTGLTRSCFGDAAGHLRSQALIALRNGSGTIGLIALGSEEEQRFYAGMGTVYLERLGEMVSAALARTLY